MFVLNGGRTNSAGGEDLNYVVEQNASQVQVAIDASSREISAKLVDGGVNTKALADEVVTKEKLDSDIQESLEKVDPSIIASGECGLHANDDVTWTLYSDGLLKITGKGTAAWQNLGYYKEKVKKVIIEDGITQLYMSFDGYTNLTHVDMPDSLTVIDYYTFRNCTNLTHVDIPDSVTEILNSSFSNTGITSITLPSSLSKLDRCAFMNCTNLKHIHIPNGVTILSGEYAFQNCTNLTSINIPNSVTTIVPSAFTNCNKLTDVYYYEASSERDVPTNDRYSGIDVFADVTKHYGEIYDENLGCSVVTVPYDPDNIVVPIIDSGDCSYKDTDDVTWTLYESGLLKISGTGEMVPKGYVEYKEKIKDIVIEDGITYIWTSAFSNCSNLETVTMSDSVTGTHYAIFGNCTNLKAVNLSNNLTGISNFVFQNCTSLKSINIPNSITRIDNAAFYGCTGLASITIPNSVTSIDSNVFNNCTGLKTVNFPNISNIGTFFSGCTNLTDIYFYDATSEDDVNIDIADGNGIFINANKHYGEIFDEDLGCPVKTKINMSESEERIKALEARIAALEAASEEKL